MILGIISFLTVNVIQVEVAFQVDLFDMVLAEFEMAHVYVSSFFVWHVYVYRHHHRSLFVRLTVLSSWCIVSFSYIMCIIATTRWLFFVGIMYIINAIVFTITLDTVKHEWDKCDAMRTVDVQRVRRGVRMIVLCS